MISELVKFFSVFDAMPVYLMTSVGDCATLCGTIGLVIMQICKYPEYTLTYAQVESILFTSVI